MEPLRARDVGGIIQRGGAVLGSARCAEFREDSGRAWALRNLARREIDALIVIGGDGSQTGSNLLARGGFPVVGVASTIDNDVCGTDATIGVDTAVNITLGHVVRGGIPSAFDRVLATRLGAASVDRPARGAPGVLVGVLDNDIVATPLADVAGRTKPIDLALLALARVLAQ